MATYEGYKRVPDCQYIAHWVLNKKDIQNMINAFQAALLEYEFEELHEESILIVHLDLADSELSDVQEFMTDLTVKSVRFQCFWGGAK